MSSTSLVRLGGLGAILSGASWTIAEFMYLIVGFEQSAESYTTISYLFQSVLFLLGGVLLVGALIGLYAGRSDDFGALGAFGFLVALVGTVLVAGSSWEATFVLPPLARDVPEFVEAGLPALLTVGLVLSFIVFCLGWLLLGVAILRTRVYPRAAAVLLIVGSILAFFPLPFTYIVFSVAVAWMGFSLLSGKTESSQSPRVT